MTERARRERRTRGGMDARRKTIRTPLAALRRAQMISTYGVGALVAIDDRSYVVSGTDAWKVDDEALIFEPRLQHRLGVHGFHLPPAASPPTGDGVRIRLFPETYSCSTCHALKRFRDFGSPSGKSVCGACEMPLTPSRFVLACENGHLDDFPYFAWVHKRTSPTDPGENVAHELSLHSSGRTASLRSVVVRCTCGKEASLEGAFGRSAMRALGITCTGRRPWLGRDTEESGCGEVPRTLQRGSSAAWFPVNRSALSIPPWSETLQKRVQPHLSILKTLIEQDMSEEALETIIKNLKVLDGTDYTHRDVVDAVHRRLELDEDEHPAEEYGGFEPAERLRREEFEKLRSGTGEVDRGQDFECTRPVGDPASGLPYGIERVMQVKRLREVRALQAFTRVRMPEMMDPGDRPASLSNREMPWLPAIEVSGEGVFLGLDLDEIQQWEARPEVLERATRIKDAHTAQLRRRARSTSGSQESVDLVSPISPRYMLLHTLAHVLINEWSLEAGYSAASLRERLYVSDAMAGVLIYTATSDSAGSLGGVIAQGEYGRLNSSLESGLNRASWCSQDPPCMESEASGVDGLNLAACYACVLLPETSCETNNTFLDRAVLLGTPEHPSVGFFSAAVRG